MGVKQLIRKIAKFILASSPATRVEINVAQIQYGRILEDRKVVITGGGRGLGYAMAEKFVSEGAQVVIAGRNETVLKQSALSLGDHCQYVQFDVTDFCGTKAFLERCSSLMGGIDTLVCNAGVSLHEGGIQNVTLEGWDKTFDINLKADYFLSQAFIDIVKKQAQKSANLLLVSSETANQCYDTPYGLSKAAVNSLVGALSRRQYKNGMRVNAIAPGVTASDMTKEYADVSDGNMYRNCASGRVFKPEEVAEVACFVISDAAKCISGEVIHCNAGNHLSVYWND